MSELIIEGLNMEALNALIWCSAVLAKLWIVISLILLIGAVSD